MLNIIFPVLSIFLSVQYFIFFNMERKFIGGGEEREGDTERDITFLVKVVCMVGGRHRRTPTKV